MISVALSDNTSVKPEINCWKYNLRWTKPIKQFTEAAQIDEPESELIAHISSKAKATKLKKCMGKHLPIHRVRGHYVYPYLIQMQATVRVVDANAFSIPESSGIFKHTHIDPSTKLYEALLGQYAILNLAEKRLTKK